MEVFPGLASGDASTNPYKRVLEELVGALSEALGVEGGWELERLITTPPRHVGADLAFPLMRYTRGRVSGEALSALRGALEGRRLFQKAELMGGFLNVWLDPVEYSRLVFSALESAGDSYGAPTRLARRLRVVVEHTSANPVHPIHLGTARNTSIGDTLARMLSFYGHDVNRRFYVDDVGAQTAYLAYGLSKLGDPGVWRRLAEGWKPDHFIGLVYALTYQLVELASVKRRVEALREEGGEEYREALSTQDRLVNSIARLSERHPRVFNILSKGIMSDPDPQRRVYEWIGAYERGEEPVKSIVREAVRMALEGMQETLRRFNTAFDAWDYESDLVWKSLVGEVLARARSSPYFTLHKEAEALDLSSLAEDPELRRRLRIPGGLDVPPLILRRSDGTTLYTTRDVAYSIYKFRETGADLVVNVVGKEQTLPQAQVRLALHAIGYGEMAERMIHYSYEMVALPGRRMSSRRGEIVTVDEVLDMLRERAKGEIEARRMPYQGEEREAIAEKIAVGALRYFLVSVDADKPLTLKLDEVLDFERNTAPYIQYSYARASGILRKAGSVPAAPHGHEPARERGERFQLLKLVGEYPYRLERAVAELRPEYLVEYLGRIASAFHRWYDTDPVLGERDETAREYKLALVAGVRRVLGGALRLLGVEPLERM